MTDCTTRGRRRRFNKRTKPAPGTKRISRVRFPLEGKAPDDLSGLPATIEAVERHNALRYEQEEST